jgi:predicted acylesterase/phospholipase RssA
MLQALYERDVVPDVLVGTPAGALKAAFVASRAQISERPPAASTTSAGSHLAIAARMRSRPGDLGTSEIVPLGDHARAVLRSWRSIERPKILAGAFWGSFCRYLSLP